MEEVDISLILTENKYLRIYSDVEELKKSIETVGLINPLIVNQDNELIAGGRRYKALVELGYTKVNVIRVDKNAMEQELISIDENLVRKDLEGLEIEQSLCRGRELYEELHPDALKFTDEVLETPEQKKIQNDLPNGHRSFVDITAEKTGLSKKVIKSSIERAEKASPAVKSLRSSGELNASQTNQIIRLEPKGQESLAELVKDRSAKEIKHVVKMVKDLGLDAAIESVMTEPVLPREYQQLKQYAMRLNKNLSKIIIEGLTSDHHEVDEIEELLSDIKRNLEQFRTLRRQEQAVLL
jgi:ParB family chromosome partitioning protein